MFSQMTAQQLFDTMVRGLHRQGRRATDERGHCLYRGNDGTKCAAGFVLTDEEVEGKNVLSLHQITSPFTLDDSRVKNLLLLRECQVIHDDPSCWNSKTVSDELSRIANEHYLEWPTDVPQQGW